MFGRTLRRALTGGGGLARVDVSDDNDIDMSLFFTVQVGDTSAIFVLDEQRHDFDVDTASACCDGLYVPHGDRWLKVCVEVL